ncbi:diguanylate cyclase domain-containing protein [Paenibacillus sp. S-38]|uniref:diguanylate cyclase domain-containing protein n=1 Tax=Paenibacillus sp. S-38 TaxID=3416710 RepID=UPI003CF05B9F
MLPISYIQNRRLALTLGLLFVSLFADWFSIPMLYGLQYHFSSLFVILALFTAGAPAAVFISSAVALSNYFLLEMPLFDSGIVMLEALVLALLTGLRKEAGAVFLYDLLFWLGAGVCMLIGSFGMSAAAYPGDVLLYITKCSVNGAGNALAAEILLTYLPLLPWPVLKKRYKPIGLQKILVHLAISGVVFPFICFMIITGISQNQMINLRAHQIAESTASAVKDQLHLWGGQEYRALELQDIIQLGRLKAMVEKSAFPSARVTVSDKNGEVLAESMGDSSGEPDWRTEGRLYRYDEWMYLWLPAGRHFIEPSVWREAFYIYVVTVEEGTTLQIQVKVPVSQLIADVQGIYTLDFVLILAFIVLALLTVYGISRFIVHFLVKLTQETTGLPDKITAQFEIFAQDSRILEFDQLHENFRQMALKLKAMFAEATHLNTVLREQARQIKQSELQFQQLAFTDALTKLPNRLYFHSYLREVMELPGASGALLFMDLNQFKLINDTYGHEAGDALLQHAAALLKEAAGSGTVCRLGGDEFVLILPAAARAEIQRTAEQILEGFKTPLAYQEWMLQPRTSIGIACFPSDADRPEELLKMADGSMYRAKQRGSGVEWHRNPGSHGKDSGT